MSDCRRGDRIPKNKSIVKNLKVEVGVEIGLIVNIESENSEDQIKEQVIDTVIDMFEIDNKDRVLNGICIYDVQ
jgi:hypothetical protein